MSHFNKDITSKNDVEREAQLDPQRPAIEYQCFETSDAVEIVMPESDVVVGQPTQDEKTLSESPKVDNIELLQSIDDGKKKRKQRDIIIVTVLFLVVLIGFAAGGVAFAKWKAGEDAQEASSPDSDPASSADTLPPTKDRLLVFRAILQDVLDDPAFPSNELQTDILLWMSYEDPLQLPVDEDPYKVLERYVFALFYNLTQGPVWDASESWMGDLDTCEWNMLNCNNDAQVVDMDMFYLNMNGNLPSELGLLTQLTRINLGLNYLEGPIPVELASLAKLDELILDSNQLSGSIPTELGMFPRIRWLALNTNRLVGTIPSELGKLTTLKFLAVGDNSLTGSIPAELRNLTSATMMLFGNQLEGCDNVQFIC